MRFLLVALAMLNFLSYLWSVIGIFQKTNEQRKIVYRVLQVNSVSIWGYFLYRLYFVDIPIMLVVTSIFLQCILFLLFWIQSGVVKEKGFSVVFSLDTPGFLLTTGLYKYIRHPFYFIYITCYLNLSICINDFIGYILLFLIVMIYYIAARFEEDKFSKSPLAKEYLAYKKTTGMFLPKIFSA